VAEDADLTEFLDGVDGDEKPAPGDDEPGDGDEEETADDEETAEAGSPAPTAVTGAWAPGGAACDACGATVRRRWRDGAEMVCGDCKGW